MSRHRHNRSLQWRADSAQPHARPSEEKAAIERSVSPGATAGSGAPSRWPLYGLLNLGFIACISAAAAAGGNGDSHLLYLACLFALCSTPVLYLRRINDRFACYAAFFGIYFVSFGVLDLGALTAHVPQVAGVDDALSKAELVILLSGVAFAVGYLMASRREEPSTFAVKDWPMRTLIVAGLAIWAAGTYATWYWQVRLTVRSGEFVNHTGMVVTTLIMLGRYAQPLGLLAIAYAYMTSGSKILTLVMIVLAIYQVYLGYISDTKGGAMMGGILVIVTSVLANGKIPKLWLLAALGFIVVVFPIFQAHRVVIVGERGTSNAAAAGDLARDVELSIAGEKKAQAEHAQSFFQRSSVKGSVEMIVSKTGESVPYQRGYTFLPLITSLIPRLIWPDKPSVETGQLVNAEFHVTGERTTYISPSHLGEMYWNFGWAGALIGMFLLGALIGWINAACDLSESVSVTRVLILGITILQLEVRFEASIATEYSMWLRSMVGILCLHWLLARDAPRTVKFGRPVTADPLTDALPLNRFPNLLR